MMKNFDVILNTVGFDAQWYERKYLDCVLSGLSAPEHYRHFGHLLGRGLSESVPNPLQVNKLVTALYRKPVVSYCIPVMNRLEDIQATLADNLEANREIADQVEFIVLFLDDDAAAHDWVKTTFPEDLASGYLRLVVRDTLDSWHFGKAKNQFKDLIVGQVYSSLDGDNFVTREETEQLLEVAANHPGGFVFHHFTGNWGDGSSGRVSTTLPLYQEVGYDDKMMPRQFDEMDLIISTMARYPNVPLLRLHGEVHCFSSTRCKEFLALEPLHNEIIEVAMVERRVPLNPRGAEYIDEDPSYQAMLNFNQSLSFMRNAIDENNKDRYYQRIISARHKIIDAIPQDKVLATIFKDADPELKGRLKIGKDDVCIFGCMKDDDLFLPAFYKHHKALGFKYFFLIDDGSKVPLEDTLPYDDVFVFRPKIGDFRTAKAMWMEGLMKAFLPEDGWLLTVDADEFFELPKGYDSINNVVRSLDKAGKDYMPALLIDMVPGASTAGDLPEDIEADFFEALDHYVFEPTPMPESYANEIPIKWGFGVFSDLSWALDARYHAFKTLDSLRKIPLIRWQAHQHINQGFHTLHFTDDTPEPKDDIWQTDEVLIIRHFKLLKLFSKSEREQAAASVSAVDGGQYHARTNKNIKTIFSGKADDNIDRILSLPKRSFSDNYLRTLSPKYFSKPTKTGT